MAVPQTLGGLDLARSIRSQVKAGNIEWSSLSDSDAGLLRDLEKYENLYMGHAQPHTGGQQQVNALTQLSEMRATAEEADNQLLISEFGNSDPAFLLRMKELGVLEGLRGAQGESQAQAGPLGNRFIDPETGGWTNQRPAPSPLSNPEVMAPAPAQPQAQAAAAPTRQRSSASSSSRRSESPASAGKTLGQYNTELDLQILDVERRIAGLSSDLNEYDADSEKSAPDSDDLLLMRKLAQQINNQPTGPYSNIAAQLAMVQDPNFSKVWDGAIQQRINKARHHFGRMGQIQRMAQGEKAARSQYRSRGRKRSEEKLKILGREKNELIKAKHKLASDQRNEEFRREMAHINGGYRMRSAVAGRPGAPMDLFKQMRGAQGMITTANRAIEKLSDPSFVIKTEALSGMAAQFGKGGGESRASLLKIAKAERDYWAGQQRKFRSMEQQGATKIAPVLGEYPSGARAPSTTGGKPRDFASKKYSGTK